MDIMKILAELYLHQQGIEATVKTEPLEEEENKDTVSDKTA